MIVSNTDKLRACGPPPDNSFGAILEHCKEDLFEVLASYFPVDYEAEEAFDAAEQSVPIYCIRYLASPHASVGSCIAHFHCAFDNLLYY